MEISIEELIRYYEKQGMTEEDILDMTAQLVMHCDSDLDLMYELNDIVYQMGYSFEFDVPRTKR